MKRGLGVFFVGVVLIALLFKLGSTSDVRMAEDVSGPVELEARAFGSPVGGSWQKLSSSEVLEEAKEKGLLEEARYIRSGWIDRVASRTGRLDSATASGGFDGCTGTAISHDLILTNAHCVQRTGPKRTVSMLFLPNHRDPRRTSQIEAHEVDVNPIEIGDPDGLDYAVLRLRDPLPQFEPMVATIRDPGPGEPLVVIGHPEGQPLLVSRGRCQSDPQVPIDGDVINHQCATRKGSSGSLVWTTEGHLVGLHYWGYVSKNGNLINRAVRFTALVDNSPILRRLLRRDPNDRDTAAATIDEVSPEEQSETRTGSENSVTPAALLLRALASPDDRQAFQHVIESYPGSAEADIARGYLEDVQ